MDRTLLQIRCATYNIEWRRWKRNTRRDFYAGVQAPLTAWRLVTTGRGLQVWQPMHPPIVVVCLLCHLLVHDWNDAGIAQHVPTQIERYSVVVGTEQIPQE